MNPYADGSYQHQARGQGRRARSAARYLTEEDLRRSWDSTIQSRFQFWLRERWFSRRQLLRWRPGTEALRELEGQCGSAAALTFAFVRWVGELNAALACIAFLALVLPFFLHPPPGYSAQAFVGGSLGALLQGSGLEETWVLYGGYQYSPDELGSRTSYKFDLAFSLFVCALFAVSLALLLVKIASRYSGSGDRAFVGAARLYPFASVVFASCDFHITSLEAVRALCRGIRVKLKEMLGDCSLEDIQLSRAQQWTLGGGCSQVVQKLRRIAGLFVLWPLVIVCTGYVVLTLVQELDYVNNTIGQGFGYTQSVFLVLCNLAGKQLVYLLVAFEQWPPNMVMPVLAAKLFCLRVISDIMLVYELYNKYGRLEGSVDTCMENDIGIVLLRVAVGNIFLSQGGNALFHWVEFKRGVMYDFEAAEMVIDTISNQSIVWIGSMVSPVVPLIGCVGNALTFTLTKWWLIRTCKPVKMSFSANRTSNLPYGMLLSTLALSTIPATYWLGQDRSRSCGPIPGTSMMKTMMDYLSEGPLALRIFLSWVANPLFMILMLALLVLWLIVTRAKLIHRHKEEDILREELHTARQEIAQRASNKQHPRIFENARLAGD